MSYTFVDGAYLTRAMSDWGVKWFGEPATFEASTVGWQSEKVFYYDAPDTQREGESLEQFGERERKQTERFDALRREAGWHVFLGDSKRRGRGQTKRIDQKEVDVLLAVDMLTHAHRKNTDRMILFAGDLDFRPLLEALVREGIFVILRSDPRSTSAELMHAADAVYPLTFDGMHRLSTHDYQRRYPAPVHSRSDAQRGMAGAAMVAQGFIDGGFAATMFRQTVGSRVAISSGRPDRSGVYGYVESENEDFARRLFEEHYGVHEWRLVDRTG